MDFTNIFNPEHNLPEVSGFDSYSELSNQDVENLITTLIPEDHLDNCVSIVCDPTDSFWYENPGAVGYHVEYFDGTPSNICLAGDEINNLFGGSELATLCHEIGHNAYNNLSLETQIQWDKIHSESIQIYNETGFGFVSNYAHTNVFEDFAETYSFYMNDPDLLKFMSPEKYDFMQEQVFSGIEYGQITNDDGKTILVTKDVVDLNSQLENQATVISPTTVGYIASSAENSPNDSLFRCFNKIG